MADVVQKRDSDTMQAKYRIPESRHGRSVKQAQSLANLTSEIEEHRAALPTGPLLA